MYEETKVSRDILLEAAAMSAVIYTNSLIRQFIDSDDEEQKQKILRPSALGKPAMDTFAKRFHPELYHVEETVDNQLKQLFHEGDTLEADVYFHLVRTGVEIVEIQPEITWNGITGHGDFIIRRGNRKILLECKSSKDSYFKQCNRKGLTDDRGYLTQLAVYEDALKIDAEWIIYNKDNSSCVYIDPPAADTEVKLARAKKIVDAWDKVTCWEDVFKYFKPAPPTKEYANRKWTGRWMIPLAMWNSPAVDLVYELYEDKNAKGETRRYVADYLYPESMEHLKPILE